MCDNECPICLETIKDTDNTLRMPVCMHKIHTQCALQAAQYDMRCPLCRTKDESLEAKPVEEEMNIFQILEETAEQHERIRRRYQRKRRNVINVNRKLKVLDQRIRQNNRLLNESEKELERTWMQLQRKAWKENPEIQRLKKERQDVQRRRAYACRILEREIEAEIGPNPLLWDD